MHFAYIDDSGNVGAGGSKTYTLACILVDTAQWLHVFDGFIEYRRFLAARFRIPPRMELKANWLLQNTGQIRKLRLSVEARAAVYRGVMRLMPKLGVQVFAVVIQKERLAALGRTDDPRQTAWDYLIQRLQSFTRASNTNLAIYHDEGEDRLIRKIVRKARRAGTAGSMFGGSLPRPATRILEDPSPRRSHESYFIQAADLAAYAAFRRVHPIISPGREQVVPNATWDELGSARRVEVSRRTDGIVGIVVWP